jgi:hypothetical protein
MDIAWRNFLGALRRDDYAEAGRYWDQMGELRAQRTPEQVSRALVLAELTPDGTCSHARQKNGVCLKCLAIVTNGRGP